MKRMYDLVGDLPRMEGEFLSNEFQIVVVLHAGRSSDHATQLAEARLGKRKVHEEAEGGGRRSSLRPLMFLWCPLRIIMQWPFGVIHIALGARRESSALFLMMWAMIYIYTHSSS